MQVTDKIYIENCDNMELMARYPDKYFDLAIVDPPYGIGDKFKGGNTGSVNFNKIVDLGWDNSIPSAEYFNELFRVSKHQIIWGGNYFTKYLKNNRCFVVWDKCISEEMSLSMAEYAWVSFDERSKIYKLYNPKGNKIHPTEKPVELYKWLIKNYAKSGNKILDTHGGSMSIAIACHDYDYELTLCELDKDYYESGIKRIKNHVGQIQLFL